MRIYNYERYENIKLWMKGECKTYERNENIKLWKKWESTIMKYMRI